MKEIIVLMGLPGSGKSTLIKHKEFEDYVVFEYDNERKKHGFSHDYKDSKKFNEKKYVLLQELIKINDKVIIDGVHSSAKARRRIYNICKQIDKNSLVTIIMLPLIVPQSKQRQLKRDLEKQVPVNIIEDMARQMSLPRINQDCDVFQVYNTDDTTIDIEEHNKKLKKYPHGSIYHLESIGTHISMILKNIEDDYKQNKLTDYEYKYLTTIAKYHDIGKPDSERPVYGLSRYLAHEHLSFQIYLATNIPVNKMLTLATNLSTELDNQNKDYYQIALSIDDHIKAHDTNKVDKLTKMFSEYDSMSKIETPLQGLNSKIEDEKYRKYIFKYNYAPVKYFYDVLKAIQHYNLSKEEVEILVKESQKYMNMRSSIYSEKNKCISDGLEAFFNVNQFKFTDKITKTETEKIWSNFFVDISTPKGNVEKYNKLDGSLVQIIKCKDQIKVYSRGTFEDGEFKFINGYDNPKVEVINEAIKLIKWLDKQGKTFEEGDSLFAEWIGKSARIVCKYDVKGMLVPLIYKSKGQVYHYHSRADDDYNMSDFIEGYVLLDEEGTMFKSKTPEYLKYHGLKYSQINKYSVLNFYMADNLDDLMSTLSKEEIEFFTSIFDFLDNELFSIPDEVRTNYLELINLVGHKYATLYIKLYKQLNSKKDIMRIYFKNNYLIYMGSPELDYLKADVKRKLIMENKDIPAPYVAKLTDNKKTEYLELGRKIEPKLKTLYTIIDTYIQEYVVANNLVDINEIRN